MLHANAVCPTNTTKGVSSFSPLNYKPNSFHLVPQPLMYVSTQRAYSRTGIIYNVTPRAVGILINKRVGNRYIQKRVNIRVEHIKHSQGRQVFLDRVKKNEKARIQAKEKGGKFGDLGSVAIGY